MKQRKILPGELRRGDVVYIGNEKWTYFSQTVTRTAQASLITIEVRHEDGWVAHKIVTDVDLVEVWR